MKLHDYQLRSVDHLHTYPRAALFMEPGLGKTATVLTAVDRDHFPMLVIAPKRVAENVWLTERDKWRRDLTMAVAAGSPKKRAEAFAGSQDITVVGIDNVKDVPLGKYKTVVLDELSKWKNKSTNRWRLTRKITDQAEFVWGLTGSPAPNGLIDLWAQLFLLDKGERLGTTLTGYRNRYFDPDKRNARVVFTWKLKPGADTAIHRRIEDICLSMKAEDYLELPPVMHNEIQLTLPPMVRQTYKDMQDQLVADLAVYGSTEMVTSANAAVLTSKLSQISAGFLYDDFGNTEYLHEEKAKTVADLIEDTGSPVLVFYQFDAEAKELHHINGVWHIGEPNAIEAWNAGDVPAMIAHPASAAHGLNLQDGGHTIIWSSLTWSPEEWEQANARLARQGQGHPVMIHRLVAAGIDRAKYRRVQDKLSVQDALKEALK